MKTKLVTLLAALCLVFCRKNTRGAPRVFLLEYFLAHFAHGINFPLYLAKKLYHLL